MGSFAYYQGDGTIPENQKVTFKKQMRRILDLGGMMEMTEVKMFDQTLPLLRPIQQMDEKDIHFYYNYFEECSWESAGFDTEKTHLWSGKIGSAEFSDTMTAAYMLYELCLPGYGFAKKDGVFVEASGTVGWLNQILGTDFSIGKRADIWYSIEQDMAHEDSYQLSERMLKGMIPYDRRTAAGGTDLADLMYIINGTAHLSETTAKAGTYPADVLNCKQELLRFLQMNSNVDLLWNLLEKSFAERSRIEMKALKPLAQLTLKMPARVFVYLTAKILKTDFWSIWKQLSSKVYQDEQMNQYVSDQLMKWRKKKLREPVEPLRTSEYLRQDGWFTFYDTPEELRGKPYYYLSDADRLYWWDDSDEVQISEKTDAWLKEKAALHKEIMKTLKTPGNATSELHSFLNLLVEINAYYWRIYPFETMFYDFVENISRKEYLAGIELMRKIADSEENRVLGKLIYSCRSSEQKSKNVVGNDGRLQVKRIYAVFANKALRKKYFDF